MDVIPRGRLLRRAGIAAVVSVVLTVTGFATVVVAAEPLAPALTAEAESRRHALAAAPTVGAAGDAVPSAGRVTSEPGPPPVDPEAARQLSHSTPTATDLVATAQADLSADAGGRTLAGARGPAGSGLPGSGVPGSGVPGSGVPADESAAADSSTPTGTGPSADPGRSTEGGTPVDASAPAPAGGSAPSATPEPAAEVPVSAAECIAPAGAVQAGSGGDPCGEADPSGTGTAGEPGGAIVGEVRMAVVGDSLSSGSTQRLERLDQADAGTWVSTAIGNDRVAYAGGWAQWGSTSIEQAEAVYPVHCDLLVLLTGTNDIRDDIGFAQQTLDMDRIADVIGAPRVLVLALPPNDKFPEAALGDRNVSLQQYAATRGWDFYDPWTGFREGQRWAAGANLDGDAYHPTDATHAVVGQRIGDYIAARYAPQPALAR
jgi:hypothetical protein